MKIKNNLFILQIKDRVIGEAERYTLVGIFGFCVRLVIFYALTEFLNLYYLLSSIITMTFVGLIIFMLDKTWTFHEKLEKNFFKEYYSFACVGIFSVSINIGVLYSLTTFLGIYYVISQAIAIIIAGAFGFTCNELWTFHKKRK